MGNKGVVVVGASNMDLISYVQRLPNVGETSHGKDFQMGYGGKGANQAVMAAKLGARVTFITKVGDDIFGKGMIENLGNHGVDTNYVYVTNEASSGVAPIAVDTEGRNSIIIITGANDLLSKKEIQNARKAISDSQIVVCQLEIPVEITLEALRIAKKADVMTILNPAPGHENLSEELFLLSDIVCPNESEATLLTGITVDSLSGAGDAARSLIAKGAKKVLITLGDQGCLFVDKNVTEHFSAQKVEAIDTTGAGDAFLGSLAFFLSSGKSFRDSISRSNQIAALSVQRKGTQTSFPNAAELPTSLIE